MATNPLKAHELTLRFSENQGPFQLNPQDVEKEPATQALNLMMNDTRQGDEKLWTNSTRLRKRTSMDWNSFIL